MSTDDPLQQDCIGDEDDCVLCGADDPVRLGFFDDRPSIYACWDCAPSAGQPPTDWFKNEVLPEVRE